MSEQADMLGAIRRKILAEPEVVLEDHDLMRALIDANERAKGGNIVDLRGIAMERLESRLDRLEDTHRSVIAAAYENLAGTNLIHNAVLKLLDPTDFTSFLDILSDELPACLRVAYLRLILESHDSTETVGYESVLSIVEPGTIEAYVTGGRGSTVRPVTLRQVAQAPEDVYGPAAQFVRSEALLTLDLGPGRLPGLLVMASEDPHQFKPSQGTDLLTFFGGAFERSIRRWLA
ncbi:MAG: DUF484 family protein [Pseudomonadota bacterium]